MVSPKRDSTTAKKPYQSRPGVSRCRLAMYPQEAPQPAPCRHQKRNATAWVTLFDPDIADFSGRAKTVIDQWDSRDTPISKGFS